MGNCAENTAKKMSISRQEQDNFALRSYRLSCEAYKKNVLQKEIVEVRIPQKKGKIGFRQFSVFEQSDIFRDF